MAHPRVKELRASSDKAWAHLRAQLSGMDPYLDRCDSPGEWTAREVLSHLLEEPGWKPAALLKSFAVEDLPLVEIKPGDTYLTPERKTMSLKQFKEALEAQHRDLGNYLEGLTESDLARKARIPLFKEFMGIEEIDIPTFVGALFDYHWNDHAGQLAKIRRAVGLPDVK